MNDPRSLNDKTCLITGGTSGIGAATVVALARHGATIIFTSRDEKKGSQKKKEYIQMTGNRHINFIVCDFSSFKSIRECCLKIKKQFPKLNILINNAGIMERQRKMSLDKKELVFAVNYLSPFLLTSLLLDTLMSNNPSCIINISSQAHRFGKLIIDDLEGKKKYSPWAAYCQSKLALTLFTLELSSRVHPASKVTVNCFDPGMVKTKINDYYKPLQRKLLSLFLRSPESVAKEITVLLTSRKLEEVSGQYFQGIKNKKPSKKASDQLDAALLWNKSCQYTDAHWDI